MLSAYLFAEAHILLYHRFDDPRERVKSVNIKTSELREQFSYLKKNGYKVIKLSELVEKIKNKKTIEDKTIALTIDDAYDTFYKNGLPVFKEFNYHFTLFVYVDAVDHHFKDYMNWDEVKESAKYGDIALHSYKHPNLTELSEKEIREDTKEAFDHFSTKMGYKPKYYAYPFGKYNHKVKDVLASFGFEGIFNVDSGAVDNFYDPMNLDRMAMDSSSKLPELLKVQPLKLDLKINQVGDKITVKGKIENSKTKSIFIRVSKAKIFNIKTPKGEFEVSFGKDELNSKRKIAFFTEDHRQFTKLLDKE
jgi:peptidoglycan/xylan/chitin deacetylase (PgdA/CDA1 family)